MKVSVFSTKSYDRQFLDQSNVIAGAVHRISYFEAHLDASTAALARGSEVVCPFVNDQVDRDILEILARQGTRLIALRGAGFNNVDLAAAAELGIAVARVPAYSPHAIAEHTVALILALDRKIHRAYARVREGNFSLEGLLGFDLHGRTIGIIGTGRIGTVFARIMAGFGCQLLAFDPVESEDVKGLGGRYVPLNELLSSSDVITLHCPLTPETRHLIDRQAIERMKRGVMLINTSRGAVVDTTAIVAGLKSGTIAHLGLDVYEEEGDLFFEDLSDQAIRDDLFARLLTFPNVLITGHQAFFTSEAMQAIAETTIANIAAFEASGKPLHEVTADAHLRHVQEKGLRA
ncbi:2-hydroxyacid dehydrogenase [Sphingomonas piscis]|uniref:2-hydroxyacid dehydrogenase n=1 Tax=Sphingomonas piscis TaxID=2714943 RepID=A0A6G7YTC8_9SPHN|nr:2-hydroxyacid dehydrogenase [Sphingomonas piscis]QIK79993.1 2-hydroxyacid dehydrogenase [Sphingomonas piscis]